MASIEKFSNWRIGALLVGGAIGLVACGGESPEAVQDALAQGVPLLAYVEESEGECVANAMTSEVGFEQLNSEGHTSQSIALAPSESIATILASHDGPSLRASVANCLDVDSMIRPQLIAANGNTALTCDVEFVLGNTIVDDFLSQRFDGEDATIHIDDTTENRDLLRPCFEETSFAETFGIDTRADLETAIEMRLDEAVANVDEPCVAFAIVEHFGSAEATNQAGITVRSPAVDFEGLGLTGSELVTFLRGVSDCVDFATVVADQERMREPTFAPCLIEEFHESDDWQIAAAQGALDPSWNERGLERHRNTALDSCLLERIAEVYEGSASPGHIQQANRHADQTHELAVAQDAGLADYGHSEAHLHCAFIEVVQTVDLLQMVSLAKVENPNEPSAELQELWKNYTVALNAGSRKCATSDFSFAWIDIVRAGFGTATLDCVRAQIDESLVADQVMTLNADIFGEDFGVAAELATTVTRVHSAVESCYEDDEEAVYEDWLAYVTNLSDFNSGEPDSSFT